MVVKKLHIYSLIPYIVIILVTETPITNKINSVLAWMALSVCLGKSERHLLINLISHSLNKPKSSNNHSGANTMRREQNMMITEQWFGVLKDVKGKN